MILPSTKKVIIFDWDDTICPSSYVDQCNIERFSDLPLHSQNLFNEIGRCAERCLDSASKFGEVIIITNSDDGWVKFSAERFLPNILPCLERYRIISARTQYEHFYPSQPLCWKAAAFAHEVNEIFCASSTTEKNRGSNGSDNDVASLISTENSSSSIESNEKTKLSSREDNGKQIISFGDSMEERTSVKIVANQLDAMPKSVLFIHSPTPIQILGQLMMLSNHMDFVCNNTSSLDLEITVEQAVEAANTYFNSSPPMESNSPTSVQSIHHSHGGKYMKSNMPHSRIPTIAINGSTQHSTGARVRLHGSKWN